MMAKPSVSAAVGVYGAENVTFGWTRKETNGGGGRAGHREE